MAGFARPKARDGGARERMSRCGFGNLDRSLQKERLLARQSGRDFRITIGFGIVADPKIQPTVRGKKNRVARDEQVVCPGGRGSERDPRENRQCRKISPAEESDE